MVWVTNIPAPYRNHRYELFREEFAKAGLTFTVFFMAKSEPGRHWPFEPSAMRYPYRVFRGLHVTLRSATFHLNLGLIVRLLISPPKVLVLGGYLSPTLMLLRLLMRRRTVIALGSESTVDDGGSLSGPRYWVKRWMVKGATVFIGPGDRAKSNLETIYPNARLHPFLRLPNIVDDHKYGSGTRLDAEQSQHVRARLGVSPDEQLWLLPARLEPYKGVTDFLRLLRGLNGVRVVIAGSGSQAAECAHLIATEQLPAQLIGQQQEIEMLQLYGAADLFVLPSLRDSSPLSAIEALAAGLPVLLSSRAGNCEEVVNGCNGWVYDPASPERMRELLRSISGRDRAELDLLGKASRNHYDQEFASRLWVRRFIGQLRSVNPPGTT